MRPAIRMFLTGDTMLSQPLPRPGDPDCQVLNRLAEDADVAFTNLESCVREHHEGAANFTLGTPMTTAPDLIDDLKWLGFDIVSCANNHAADYGADGIKAMVAHLKRAGLAFAGAGADLAAARSPGYVETPAGMVALVAATSFFKPHDRASEARGESRGRPGINPFGFTRRHVVDPLAFDALKRMAVELGLAQEAARHRAHFFSPQETPTDSAERIAFLGNVFQLGDGFAVETQADAADAQAILARIAEARRHADWVIFSFHCHEFGPAGRLTATKDAELEEPAGFARVFARAAIDAGADVVAGHGPHLTLGVELHQGRPIFYSLGNFIFENDKVDILPAESYARFGLGPEAGPADFFAARTGNFTRGFPATEDYWEGVGAEAEWRDGALAGLRLHPIDLGFGAAPAERGRPRLARGSKAARTLERVQRLSRRFGTEIAIDGGVGIVRL